MNPIPTIYEIVDDTDEDRYYTLGLYLDLEEAIKAASTGDTPPTDCFDDFVNIEIRARPLNRIAYGDTGEVVATVEWREKFDEDSDETRWHNPTVKRITPPDPPAEPLTPVLCDADALIARAEALEDKEELIYCAEALLLRSVASAAHDVSSARNWKEFRENFPMEKMQDALDEAVSAYDQWTRDSQPD